MNTLELKLLAVIINELADIKLNKNNNKYQLCLFIKRNKLDNLYLVNFLKTLWLDEENADNLFNYDESNNRYYIYGSKVIKLFGLLPIYEFFNKVNSTKVLTLLNNKNLFNKNRRSPLTEEEIKTLEEVRTLLNGRN